jgi:hypothetical protein
MSAQPIPVHQSEPTCAECGKPLGFNVWLDRDEELNLVHASCLPRREPLTFSEEA